MFRILQALEREPEDASSRALVTSTEVTGSKDSQVYCNLKKIILFSGRLLQINLVPDLVQQRVPSVKWWNMVVRIRNWLE